MPTYTVLGGNGSTGSAVIRSLVASPPSDLTLRVFVRSKSKLLKLIPDLSTRSDTTIVEAPFTDQDALAKCLSGSDAIFACIATTDSAPGTSVAFDSAAAIIAALKDIRSANRKTYVKPVVLLLSSASVSSSLKGEPPKVLKAFLYTALFYIYEDLRKAEALVRECGEDDAELLDAIFVQPGALLPGTVPTGYMISTEKAEGTLSFADLGVAMVEMAEKREELKWKGVSALSTGKVGMNWGPNIRSLMTGLLAYYLPAIWTLGKGWGIW